MVQNGRIINPRWRTVISATAQPICIGGYTKVTKAQNHTLAKFKMVEAAILNIVFGHILVINEDISVKLGVQIDSGHTRVTAAQYLTFGKI